MENSDYKWRLRDAERTIRNMKRLEKDERGRIKEKLDHIELLVNEIKEMLNGPE